MRCCSAARLLRLWLSPFTCACLAAWLQVTLKEQHKANVEAWKNKNKVRC